MAHLKADKLATAAQLKKVFPKIITIKHPRLFFGDFMREDLLFKQLGEITGSENLLTSKAQILPYAQSPCYGQATSNENLPLAVARPRHVGHLRKLLDFCRQEGLPIGICGGNTALAPKNYAPGALLILTSGLNRIHEINGENRLADVDAGVTLTVLGKAAAEKGLFFPPNPASANVCTVGGAISTNTAGSSSLKYGPVANYIQSLRVMTVQSGLLSCQCQHGVPGKIAAGYPLAPLFCGSAGSLGIICNASLKLMPMPKARQSCVAIFKANDDAVAAVTDILAAMITPGVMDFVDKECAALLHDAWHGPALLLTLEGREDEVLEDREKCRAILLKHGAEIARDFEDSAQAPLDCGLIAPRLHGAFGNFLFEQVSCPASGLASLLQGITEISQKHDAPIAIFGHAGIARMFVAIFINQRMEAAREAARDLFTLELVLNRRLESEQDSGVSREEWNKIHKETLQFSLAIKKAFDPGNLLPQPFASMEGAAFDNIGHL